MADGLTFKLEGVDGVLQKIHSMQEKMARKGARAATRKAMLIVRESAKRNAHARPANNPDTPETIWRNIALYESPRGGRREGGVMMRVGVRGGALSMSREAPKNRDNPGGDTRYWRYLELGAATVDKFDFMLPALVHNTGPVTETLIRELWAEINKAIGG